MKILSRHCSTGLGPDATCAGAGFGSSRGVTGGGATRTVSTAGADGTGFGFTALATRRGALALGAGALVLAPGALAVADGAGGADATAAATGVTGASTGAAAAGGASETVDEAAAEATEATLVFDGLPRPMTMNATMASTPTAPNPASTATGAFLGAAFVAAGADGFEGGTGAAPDFGA